jgi:hypothetical protein
MKKISVLLALVALLFADMAFAAGAVATSASGSVQVQTGSGTPRVLRQGDEIAQGDTVFTGGNSAVVLKFDDGQVAALTSNSRMTVSAYQYNAQARTGNVLLSLVSGGMRAITGLIGRSQPTQVSYRAATATIGIRGTDVTVVTDGTDVGVTVTDGAVSFTFNGSTIVIPAGQGAFTKSGTITPGAAASIFAQLSPALQSAVGGLNGMTALINQAGPGVPRSGGDSQGPNTGSGQTQGPGTPPGGSGGGSASQR